MWRIFHGRKREAELDEELQAHIEIEAARLEKEGSAPQAALAEARRAFGSRARVAEWTRESWGARWLAGLLRDLAYAFRSARRSPAFSAAVILSLGLGIGAATVVFSVADTVYLRPIPYPRPDRLMFVAVRMFHLEMVLSPDYVAWRRNNSTFEALAAMQLHGGNAAVLGPHDPSEIHTTRVSCNFLTALGIRPVLGRDFEAGEETSSGPKPALVTAAL